MHSNWWGLCAVALVFAIGGCGGEYVLQAHGTSIDRGEGQHVWTYRVSEPGKERQGFAGARAVVFYLTGSLSGQEHQAPVHSAMEAMAGFAMMGMRIILVDRRGVEPRGSSDLALARHFSDRPTRVADALAALRFYLPSIPAGTPLLLVGASEGADIAGAVAAAEPRVTHLLLLAGGGGMSQADELKVLVSKYPGVFGPLTAADLDASYASIRAHPEDDELWLGQPYRRWSSFLWSPPLPDLISLSIPIFVGQGDEDRSAPVESARALEQAFSAAGKTNLRYVEYPGFDHSFHIAATRANGLPRIEVDVVAWLGATGLLTPAEVAAFCNRVRRTHSDLFAAHR